MQFLEDREREERAFSKVAPGQLGNIVIDAAGTYHQFLLDLVGGVAADDIAEFKLKLNNSVKWNVNGRFLNNRHYYLTEEDADDIGQLVVDLKEVGLREEGAEYRTSVPVAGIRRAGYIESLSIEQRLDGAAPADSDILLRSMVSDPVVDAEGNPAPPGVTRTIESFPVDLREGVVILDQFTEGGISADKLFIKRIWFDIAPGHIKSFELRDDNDVRSDITIENELRRQMRRGFNPLPDMFVYDMELDRSGLGLSMANFSKFNIKLEMGADGAADLPSDMTLYVEYDGNF